MQEMMWPARAAPYALFLVPAGGNEPPPLRRHPRLPQRLLASGKLRVERPPRDTGIGSRSIPSSKMEKTNGGHLSLLTIVATAAFIAVMLAYIAHYFGLSRQQIRNVAVVAAAVAAALMVIEFSGRKLRKLK
jgi:hypothetical protein